LSLLYKRPLLLQTQLWNCQFITDMWLFSAFHAPAILCSCLGHCPRV